MFAGNVFSLLFIKANPFIAFNYYKWLFWQIGWWCLTSKALVYKPPAKLSNINTSKILSIYPKGRDIYSRFNTFQKAVPDNENIRDCQLTIILNLRYFHFCYRNLNCNLIWKMFESLILRLIICNSNFNQRYYRIEHLQSFSFLFIFIRTRQLQHVITSNSFRLCTNPCLRPAN